MCRTQLNHVEPNGNFSTVEREEFLHATQVVCARHRQVNVDIQNGKKQRDYRIWDSNEKHSLLLAGSIYSFKDISMLVQ
eukprot:gene26812-33453_t